jgi:Family of unknown function (DUF6093)
VTADAVLAAGRAAAEALMVDRCELRGADVRGARDPSTNQYTLTPGPLRYAGPCKVQTTDTIGNATAAGERLVMVTRFEVHLPVSAPAAKVDDVVTITASVADPQLVGRRFRVVSLIHKSYLTARRLAVQEVQS